MIATFIGGPRHGIHTAIEDPPARVEVEALDGSAVRYERRPPSAEDAQRRDTVQVFYAPIWMPVEEFLRRSKCLHVPAPGIQQPQV